MASNSQPSILPKPPLWWKSLTSIYQIYPASFVASRPTPPPPSTKSTTTTTTTTKTTAAPYASHLPPPPTSGLGDLKGIISKLPYLSSLGIDCIWLSPIYPSPLIDMGYDIADYTSVDYRFGSLDDLDRLINEAHGLGIRVLMDLVVNHTSDQHMWFQESCKSKPGSSGYADFYIWKDPKITTTADGTEVRSPPNNWGSFFGGSAWTYVEERGQYYLHLFDYRQPDLNWQNPRMRMKVYDDAIKFWLERGVDGFRVDTCGLYSKDQRFLDGKVDEKGRFKEFGDTTEYVINGPRIHEFWREIRREALNGYGDVLMIGELGPLGHEKIMEFVGRERRELSMVFDFELQVLGGLNNAGGFEDVGSWELPELKEAVEKNQALCGDVEGEKGDGWGSVLAENHDLPRSVSRYGSGSVTYKGSGKYSADYQVRSAKLLAIMLSCLSGTMCMYQGQEIGMTNIPESWSVDDLRDLASIEYYQRAKKEHADQELLDRIWKGIVATSRDNARCPHQWSDDKNAGFSEETPWMTVNDNYNKINVEKQSGNAESVLEFWKKMLHVRKTGASLFIYGSFHAYDLKNEKTFIFEKKTSGGDAALVVLNFSEDECEINMPETNSEGKRWQLRLSNIDQEGDKLRPWEGRLYLHA